MIKMKRGAAQPAGKPSRSQDHKPTGKRSPAPARKAATKSAGALRKPVVTSAGPLRKPVVKSAEVVRKPAVTSAGTVRKPSRPRAKTVDAGERLQKILAAAGVASRRACEQIILEGRVQVNGKTVTELGTKADAHRDEITVDLLPIRREQPVYILVNKPKGYVTTVQGRAGPAHGHGPAPRHRGAGLSRGPPGLQFRGPAAHDQRRGPGPAAHGPRAATSPRSIW